MNNTIMTQDEVLEELAKPLRDAFIAAGYTKVTAGGWPVKEVVNDDKTVSRHLYGAEPGGNEVTTK